jgi:hypothetical protein
MIIRVWLMVERSCPTKPAECQVVPSVSSCCSTTTTSRQPMRARWYAMDAPPTPPPMITQRAASGSRSGSVAPTGAQCTGPHPDGGALH